MPHSIPNGQLETGAPTTRSSATPSQASWWQSVNALLIFLLAPMFARLWVKLGDTQPSSPTKFAFGLIEVGLGFLVLVPGAQSATGGAKVGVFWLFAVCLLHTLAELGLCHVGLSSMTRRIVILNTIFHQPALYPCDGRTVSRLKIPSSPAVFPGVLPFAASAFPQSARQHERKPNPPIGAGQNQSELENQAA